MYIKNTSLTLKHQNKEAVIGLTTGLSLLCVIVAVIVAIINPRRACAARVTVVGSVCVSVCVSGHISPMERLFVLKTLSRTQRATKVKKFVGFSLKPFRCRDPALPPLYGHAYSRPFFHAYFSCTRMRISRVYTRMIHRRGFSTLVLFIFSVRRKIQDENKNINVPEPLNCMCICCTELYICKFIRQYHCGLK